MTTAKTAAPVVDQPVLTVVDRLRLAAQSIGTVAKTGHNSAQGYDFVEAAEVTRQARKALLDNGLVMTPEAIMIERDELTETSTGKKQQLITLRVAWEITDGVNVLPVVSVGQGTDSGDKGAYKALTGAMKYAFIEALMLPTGDDPEKDEAPAPQQQTFGTVSSEAATDGMRRKAFAEAGKVGLRDAAWKAFVLLHTGKTTTKELTASDIDTLLNKLADPQAVADAKDVLSVTPVVDKDVSTNE